MKLSREQYIAVVAWVSFCACVAGYGYGYHTVVAMRESVQEERKELARLTTQERHNDSLATFLATTDNERKELAGYLLSVDNPSPYLALIETTATDAGVVVEVETLEVRDGLDEKGGAVPDSGPYLRVVLNVSGTWPRVHHFVSLLEYLPYVTFIDRATVSAEDGAGQGGWGGQLHLRALVQ